MNLEAFIAELIADYREHQCTDIDGGDVHALLVGHGLWIERPATQADLDNGWSEWDVEVGDTIAEDSPELAALRKRQRKAA